MAFREKMLLDKLHDSQKGAGAAIIIVAVLIVLVLLFLVFGGVFDDDNDIPGNQNDTSEQAPPANDGVGEPNATDAPDATEAPDNQDDGALQPPTTEDDAQQAPQQENGSTGPRSPTEQ